MTDASSIIQKKDLDVCPKCGERTLITFERWGVESKECDTCDYYELVTRPGTTLARGQYALEVF